MADTGGIAGQRQIARTLLLLSFAVVLLGGVVFVTTSEVLKPYEHDVSPEGDVDEYSSQGLTQYGELSPKGKSVFREARESPSDVHTTAPVSEFEYPPNGGPADETVEYQGTVYAVKTEERQGLSGIARRGVQLLLTALGIGTLVGAVWPLVDADRFQRHGSSAAGFNRLLGADTTARLATKWLPTLGFTFLAPLLSVMLTTTLVLDVVQPPLVPAVALAVGSFLLLMH